MSLRILDPEEIAQVFAAFHDGEIAGRNTEAEPWNWQIFCPYLAEIIQPGFEYFHVNIYGAQTRWVPLGDSDSTEAGRANFPEEVLKDHEISGAECRGEVIEITLLYDEVDASKSESPGAQLFLRCSGIELFDQGGQPISYKQLGKVFRAYWDGLGGAEINEK